MYLFPKKNNFLLKKSNKRGDENLFLYFFLNLHEATKKNRFSKSKFSAGFDFFRNKNFNNFDFLRIKKKTYFWIFFNEIELPLLWV